MATPNIANYMPSVIDTNMVQPEMAQLVSVGQTPSVATVAPAAQPFGPQQTPGMQTYPLMNVEMSQDIRSQHGKVEGGQQHRRPPLSDEESTKALENIMGNIDSNTDGIVTVEEFTTARPNAKHADKIFGRFDVDGDGSLNTDEFAASQTMKFIKESFPDMRAFQQFLQQNGISKDQKVTLEQANALREARLSSTGDSPVLAAHQEALNPAAQKSAAPVNTPFAELGAAGDLVNGVFAGMTGFADSKKDEA